MPAAVVLSCPECDTKIKVRAELQGKRVRCKSCGHTFVAPAAKQGADRTAIKAKTPPRPVRQPEEEEGTNPYGVTRLDMAPRCPHCAKEMESPDAIICLHCGYNTVTREWTRTKKTVETTGQDKFMWLLPGILCVLLIFFSIGFDVFFWFGLEGLWEYLREEWDPAGESLGWGLRVWMVVFSLFVIFYSGRFAIRRLILNPEPPEIEKK
jgi:predicted Zn finger-like uncharacterized protein